MSKKEMRARLAALSFTEKINILEKLRDRSLAFAASGLKAESREKRQQDCCRSDDRNDLRGTVNPFPPNRSSEVQ